MKKLTVLAAAAGVVLYVHAQHAGVVAPTAGLTSASASGGTLSCTGLEHLWEAEGGSSSEAFMAAEIATAESAGKEYSTMHNTDGSTDRGYFQINSSHGSLSTYDPAGNAKAAIEISDNGRNWMPWVTYQTGAYRGQC